MSHNSSAIHFRISNNFGSLPRPVYNSSQTDLVAVVHPVGVLSDHHPGRAAAPEQLTDVLKYVPKLHLKVK